ncbi:MAG: ferredoxin-type protein NapG [Bacteroidota bacterium]
MTSRRKAIEDLFKTGTLMGLGGVLWGTGANEAADTELTLRPPGASEIDKEFVQECTKCGVCVEVCPYDTLEMATPGDGKAVGTPYFKPRNIPCYMCTDIPCTEKCPTGALDMKRLTKESEPVSINNSQMGLAVIHKETCLAFWGIQCDVCYRACPLIDKALTVERKINERTQKHAYLLPVVHSEFCTGCGICEHVCIVEKAAIFILPRNIATGKVSEHYIKGWDKKDEKRIEEKGFEKDDKKDMESGLDYLNTDEDLY